MEHPLRVDEFSPSEMPQLPGTEPAATEASFFAAAEAPRFRHCRSFPRARRCSSRPLTGATPSFFPPPADASS